jgi:hypothetical protein
MIEVHDTSWNGRVAKYVTLSLRNENSDEVFVNKAYTLNDISLPYPIDFSHSFPFLIPLGNQDYTSTHNPLYVDFYDIPYDSDIVTPNLSNHKFSKTFTLRNYTNTSDQMEFRLLFTPTMLGNYSGYLMLEYVFQNQTKYSILEFSGSFINGIIEMDLTNANNIFKVDSKMFLGISKVR